MNNDIFDWWSKSLNWASDEKALFDLRDYHDIWNYENDPEIYQVETNKLLSKLIYKNNSKQLQDKPVWLIPHLRDGVNLLMKGYATRESLLITSNKEFEVIKKIFDSYFDNINHIEFNIKDKYRVICDNIINQISQRNPKSIVLYHIGLTNQGCDECSEYIASFIKQYCKDNNIECIVILDDVQGEFTLPKAYDLYDIIVCTAHSILPQINCGIIIENTQGSLSTVKGLIQNHNVLEKINHALDIIESKKPTLMYFNYVMRTFLAEKNMLDFVDFNGNSSYNLSPYKCLIWLKTCIPESILSSMFNHDPESNTIRSSNDIWTRNQLNITTDYLNGNKVSLINLRMVNVAMDPLWFKTKIEEILNLVSVLRDTPNYY